MDPISNFINKKFIGTDLFVIKDKPIPQLRLTINPSDYHNTIPEVQKLYQYIETNILNIPNKGMIKCGKLKEYESGVVELKSHIAFNSLENKILSGYIDDKKINTSIIYMYKLPINDHYGWILTKNGSFYLWR